MTGPKEFQYDNCIEGPRYIGQSKLALISILIVSGLYASSLYSYLLFHSLVELFSIVTAFVIFVIAWHTRRIQDNHYLLFIGIASLSTAAIELVHMLSYKGMSIFSGFSADLPTQLWIAFRYVFSISFLIAPVFIRRTFSPGKVLVIYGVVTPALLAAIFAHLFPACFTEGAGLTPFKIYSEYAIALIFLASLGLLAANRESFDRTVFGLMSGAIVLSIASELAFTNYASVFSSANMIGHFFLLGSMVLIYRAFVVTGIVEPSNLLFRDLRKSEETIRESEERYRALVELSPVAIMVHSRSIWQYVNPAGLRLLGASSPDDIVGTPVLDRVHPDFRTMVRERIQRVEQEEGRAELREIAMFRLDGTAIDIESVAVSTRYRGEPAVQVIIKDISDRKRAERALEKSRAELSAMIEKVPIVTLLMDRERRVRKANVASAVFANRSETDMAGLRGGEALHCLHALDDPQGCGFGQSCRTCSVRSAVLSVFEPGACRQRTETDLSFIRDGKQSDRSVVLTTIPVTIEDEQLALVCIEDITARRKDELEIRKLNRELNKHVLGLKAANRELEAFAYSVSHDLRTPLRSIDGFTHAIQEEYGDRLDDMGQGYLQRVRAAAAKMGQLIDALLNLSRLTCGVLNGTSVDLSALAGTIVDELKKSGPGRAIRFNIAEGMVADGDPVMLRAVLENLLGNAWKFTGKCSTALVDFGVTTKDGERVYFVRDNGAGFDMAYANKMFTAFQRLHAADEFPGLGIGLATVQRIIHRHGGRIWAEGKPDEGATFYFTM